MKEKIISTVLVIMAVALYTVAVIDFTQGHALSGVSNVLMACLYVIIAWVLMNQRFYEMALKMIGKNHFGLIKALENGVFAKLTIVKKDEDKPEEQPTEDEKRLQRMDEEYRQLVGRLHRLQTFRDTDTYKQLPENTRVLLDSQCKAMDDYESALKQRIQLERDTVNKKD